jgi:hypothetical protein
MANSQSNTPNPSAASVPTLVCVHDSLQETCDGLDALMFFCVSEHLDAKAQSALNFIQMNLSRAAHEAKTALEAMMDAQQPNPTPSAA